MANGTVKWFNNAKGFGFVLPEGGGDDLFVHYSSIQMEGFKTLKAGEVVQYDVEEGPKGLLAVNVRPAVAEASDEAADDAGDDAEDDARDDADGNRGGASAASF